MNYVAQFMKLIDYLKSKPIIDIASVKKFRNCSAQYASLVLQRLHKRGIIYKLTRNKYTAISDIYVVATNLYPLSYLSFWSASQYFGYTTQILNTIHIVTTRRHKPILFQGYTIQFTVLPKKYFFGFHKIPTTQGFVFVAEPEKLVIDALLRPQLMGNFDEIVAIVAKSTLHQQKMAAYLHRANNSALHKRAGYLLEEYQSMDFSKGLRLDTNYVSLNPYTNVTERTNFKWRLKL